MSSKYLQFIREGAFVDPSGRLYRPTRPIIAVRKDIGDEHMTWVFEGFEVVNRCEHCGRWDREPATAHSLAEAVTKGYVDEVTP